MALPTIFLFYTIFIHCHCVDILCSSNSSFPISLFFAFTYIYVFVFCTWKWLTINRLRLTRSVTAFLFSENNVSASSFVETSRPLTFFLDFVLLFVVWWKIQYTKRFFCFVRFDSFQRALNPNKWQKQKVIKKNEKRERNLLPSKVLGTKNYVNLVEK